MKIRKWVFVLITIAVAVTLLFEFFPTSVKVTGCFANDYLAKPIANLCLFQSPTKPLVNCRPSCRVNEARLQKKWVKGLPTWAKAQIKEDLSHYQNAQPSKFYPILKEAGIVPGYIQLVQFRIKNGEVHVILPPVPDNLPNREVVLEVAARQYSPIQDILQYLAKKQYIQDTEFLLAIGDLALFPAPPTQPVFTYAKDLDRASERNLILFPDWMNLCSSTVMREKMRNAQGLYPWKDKKDQLFWRGGRNDSTGFRKKLVNYSHHHPKIVDAAFVEANQAKFVDPVDHLEYKYLVSIDGNRCSWERLVWHLHSDSLVFKHQSNQVQWFYKGISAYKDYIPLLNEEKISDQVAWAKNHPEEVQSIIKHANNFVEENFELEDLMVYIIFLLQEYTALLEAG